MPSHYERLSKKETFLLRPPKLFTPIELGGVTLPNRIVVSPMCQYSADDGSMTDWHTVHLGTFACSGAGLFVVEKTGVTREGRITHGCTGLYSDHNEAAMARVVQIYRGIAKNPIGIQLGHAGRKASSHPPFAGGKPLAPEESSWRTVAPSPIPFGEGWHTPDELTREEIGRLVDAYVAAALRAKRIGFDVLELHSAHGYLLHQFLSPLSNVRRDLYGDDRMRFPLEVARAVRETWPRERALGDRWGIASTLGNLGALLQDDQHLLPAHAREAVAGRLHHLALEVDVDVVPVREGARDLGVGLGIGLAEVVERGVGEHHAEAEGVIRTISFVDRDLGRGVRAFHQNPEIQACRSCADAADFHGGTSRRRRVVRSSA